MIHVCAYCGKPLSIGASHRKGSTAETSYHFFCKIKKLVLANTRSEAAKKHVVKD